MGATHQKQVHKYHNGQQIQYDGLHPFYAGSGNSLNPTEAIRPISVLG